jgi:HlyD family secretion protein
MKRNRVIVGGAIMVLLIIAGVFGWQRVTANATVANVRVQKASVTRGALVANVNAAGNVSAPSTAALAFLSSGRVAKITVQVGDPVKEGQLLMQLDTTDSQLALKTAQTNLASAQASYDATSANLQFAICTTQANLSTAQANFDATRAKNATNPNQLIIAKSALDKATIALQKAQSDYNAVAWRNDIGMTTQSAAVQQATIDYASAQANYQISAASINDTALRQAEASLDTAQTALQQAQKNLDTGMRTAQATLDNAKLAADQAQRNLDKLNLYAPFDGIVSAVNYNVGDSIGTTTAVGMVDLSKLEVKVMVSEVDMVKIRIGQTAMISIDALPGAMYHGTLTTISPVGMVTSGVVNYPVIVTVMNSDGKIKPGMTANLAVSVERRENVLLLPLRAVRAQGNQKIVMVEYKGQTFQVPVSTGLASDTQVEITSGLQEGDVVVLNQSQTSQTNSGAGMILMGGGPMGH